jgi:hypothetical protein
MSFTPIRSAAGAALAVLAAGELAAAQGVAFRGGTGSCVIGTYATGSAPTAARRSPAWSKDGPAPASSSRPHPPPPRPRPARCSSEW